MSLLIKALEQAARQRDSGKPARSVQPPAEPALEPLTLASPPVANGSGVASLQVEALPSAPRRPQIDEQRARAATILKAAGGSRAALAEYFRASPLIAVVSAAAVIGLIYGVYLYLQLAHPSLFVRPTPVQVPAPSAPVAAPPLEAALILPLTAPTAPESALAAVLEKSSVPPAGTLTRPQSPAVPSPASPAPAPAAASPAPLVSAPPQPLTAGEPIPTASVIASAPVYEAAAPPPAERASRPPREARGPSRDAPGAPALESRPAVTAPPARERISISAGSAGPTVHPQVELAYSALQTGRLDEAGALYAEAARSEPLNIDALLGLAYIAAQQNRREEALAHYMRILQIEPRHPVAQAAMIALMGRADPAASETRLKQLIAAEPSPFLHFVLGNLYADQQLWPQAQQAYFQAHHLEPGNADYAYNLAVGLDHLRQRKLALTYYRRATELAGTRGQANFSLAHARERIASLSAAFD